MQGTFKTHIDKRRYIEWSLDTPADCLLFWAWFASYQEFDRLHQQLLGEPATPEKYTGLRSERNAGKFQALTWIYRVKWEGIPGSVPLAVALKEQLKKVKVL